MGKEIRIKKSEFFRVTITQVEDMNTRDGKCKWNEKGFSLVELIIVIAIMAVVIGTVVFSVSMVFSANAKTCCNNLQRAIADCKVTTMGKSEAWLVLYRGSDNQIYCQMYYNEAVIENDAEGNPKDIHPQYIRFMAKNRHLAPAALEKLHSEEEENENYHVVISQIEIYSEGEKSNGVISVGKDIEITADYETDFPVEDVTLGFSFYRGDGLCCYGTNSKTDHAKAMEMTKNGKIKLLFPKVNMLPGEYWMDLYVEDRTGVRIVSVVKACHIQIYADVTEAGITRMEHSWNCIEGE